MKIDLSVKVIACAACTGRVERMLKAQVGMLDAVANLVRRRTEMTVSQAVDPASDGACGQQGGLRRFQGARASILLKLPKRRGCLPKPSALMTTSA